jgi:hypothetical protein
LDSVQPDRLDSILESLDINDSHNAEKLMNELKDKLYGRHVKLPGVDFWDFTTEGASWIVALICISVLVALRNNIRQLHSRANDDCDEPWLILDASVFGEKIVATTWLVSVAVSGWLASFGLILSAINGFETNGPGITGLSVTLSYFVFVVALIASTWAALGIVGDLLQIRNARHHNPSPRAPQTPVSIPED